MSRTELNFTLKWTVGRDITFGIWCGEILGVQTALNNTSLSTALAVVHSKHVHVEFFHSLVNITGKSTSSHLEDEPGPSGAEIVTNSAMNLHGAETRREEQNAVVDLSRANATNREENGVINLSKFERTGPEESGDVDPRSESEVSSSIHPLSAELSGLLPPAIKSYQVKISLLERRIQTDTNKIVNKYFVVVAMGC